MALVVVFDAPGVTQQKYDEVIKRLEAAGQNKPAGRLFHVGAQTEQGWLVVEVWESQKELESFAGTLGPILGEVGLGHLQPSVRPVHKLITGG